MDQEQIVSHIKSKVDLTVEEINYFFNKASLRSLKKNEHLVKSGDSSLSFILIKSGCLMTYFKDRNDHIHAIQFGQEMWWTGDLDAIFNDHSSNYAVKALVPSEVYLLNRNDFEEIWEKLILL